MSRSPGTWNGQKDQVGACGKAPGGPRDEAQLP